MCDKLILRLSLSHKSTTAIFGAKHMELWQQFSPEELDILKARARQIATHTGDTVQRQIMAALAVHIGQTVYAFPVEHLLAVYVQTPVIRVPSVPAYIQGIANIRGHITPVINLAVLFNNASVQTLPEKYYLLVASKGQNTVAFFVERMGELLSADMEQLSPISEHTAARQYLWGITPDATTIIKLASILDDDALIIDRTTS